MRDECFLIPKRRSGGGGTMQASPSIIVRRAAAIGDVIAATCVADKLTEQGFDVEFQAHVGIHCVLRRHPTLARITELNGEPHVNLDGAYEQDAGRRSRHFHEMFFEVANRQLDRHGLSVGKPKNCKPRLAVLPNDREATRAQIEKYPKPWVFICPASNAWNVRQVPPYIWEAVAPKVPGTCFWLGTHQAPPGIVDLQARHLDNIIMWLSIADLLVTVDTGPMHIAAAFNVPIVAINQSSSPSLHLNDQNDFIEVSPTGLDCLNCQHNICPKDRHLPPCQKVDPDLIASAVNARLRSVTTEDVTAVITCVRPNVETLNHCLANVLPQVQEIILTVEGGGELPQGVNADSKIKVIHRTGKALGYGSNANRGARHANGKYLWFLNDDCYVEPDTLSHLRAEMQDPKVGMVGHLLKYLDGTIQHGGKFRSREGIGFGHVDHRKYLPSITEPREVENVTGTSILVRRSAYYDTDGHNEEYFLYTEDDELCMSMRKRGWKIMYTPRAVAIHDEHLTTRNIGNIIEIMNRSNALFAKRWGRYFEHNKNREGLGNFEY